MVDTLDQLVNALESGETLESIAVRNGVTKQAVSAFLLRNNIKPIDYRKQYTVRKNSAEKAAQKERAQALFKDQGITQLRSNSIDLDIDCINKQLNWRSMEAIAAEIGTTPQTIYRRFRALNIPVSHRGRPRKQR